MEDFATSQPFKAGSVCGYKIFIYHLFLCWLPRTGCGGIWLTWHLNKLLQRIMELNIRSFFTSIWFHQNFSLTSCSLRTSRSCASFLQINISKVHISIVVGVVISHCPIEVPVVRLKILPVNSCSSCFEADEIQSSQRFLLECPYVRSRRNDF